MSGRPGGLTALAVLNFVFGGFGIIGLLSQLVTFGLGPLYMANTILGALTAALLIISGVGFLQQSRRLGKSLSLYCALSGLAGAATGMALVLRMAGHFGPFAGTASALGAYFGAFGFVYPLLLLILPRTVFRNDFTAP